MLEGPEAPVQLPGRAEDEVAVEKQADSMYPVFPSLHDEDLERLGVLAAQARRHRASAPSSVSSSPVGSPSHGFGCGGMSDKDIESKYAGLSVAFKADRVTLDQRLLRQQRQRDLAETNMAAEFTRLLEIHKRLSRATSDAERGDFLESFRSQLDALDHASRQVSWAAEMYGAVQQEDRLSHAMEVIDLYVESLKRLHQKLCQELEEKKLSENNMSVDELQDSTDEPPPRTTRYRSLSALTSNPLVGTKRRASIAAIPRPGSLGSSPVNGDVPVLSRSPGSTEGRPGSGRWSAPSRIRRVSLAMDQVPNDSHTPSQDRRDSRADSVYAHSNSASCMSEIAELSESRRESATDQADHSTSDNSCLMKALSHNGVGSSISNLLEHHPDDDDEDDDDHHHQHPDHLQPMAPNGVRRGHGAPQHVLNSMALLTDYWAQGRQLASEFWYSVSKDSFRWLRLWTVCALLVASAAVLLTALMPNTRSADRPS